MKKIICFLIITALLLTGCGKQADNGGNAAAASPVAGKKVAYILNMPSSEIFELCAQGCKETAESLGMTCDVFFSAGDDKAFKNYITDCAENGCDGLFISHGGEDYSYTFLTELLQKYPKLKIVTFDTEFKDETGEIKTIDGVTQFFQDDSGLAEELLSYVCDEMYTDKKPVNILKVWVGPDYITAFDRREVGYKRFEEEGKINTVEVVGPIDCSNAAELMYNIMKEALEKYEDGDIDAIWVAYDVYAQGAYKALKESGKNIPLVSVDLSNIDIQYMLEENSNWKACACTDFKANGQQGIRILALELNGDYKDIKDPKTGEAASYIEMPSALVTQDILRPDTTIENIYDVAPDDYGNKAYFVSSYWLADCLGY